MTKGKVLGVAHTGLTVSDLDRAMTFFRDILGGTIVDPVFYDDPIFERLTGIEQANIRIAYVELPGHKLELLQYVKPDNRRTTDLRPCDTGHLHISLLVEGIDDLVTRMREGGFEPAGPIQHYSDDDIGSFKVIYTYGFDGLVIELMDFSGTA